MTTAIPQEVAAEPETTLVANNGQEKLSVAGAQGELIPLVSPGLEIPLDFQLTFLPRLFILDWGCALWCDANSM